LGENKDSTNVSRRRFLKYGVAGAVAVAAAAAGGIYLSTPQPATTTAATTSATEMTTSTMAASTQIPEVRILTQLRPLVNSLVQLAQQQSVQDIGIKIDVDQMNFTQMAPQLTAMTAGGNIPYDVISMAHDQLGPYVSYLRTLDDLVTKYNTDLSVYFDFLTQQMYRRNSTTGRFGPNEPLVGIPYCTDAWGLQYNTKLYTEAGLVDSTGNPTPPETWDEFVEYCTELTKPPNQYGFAASYLPWWNPAWMHASYVATKGGSVLDDTFHPLINDSVNVEALEFWSDALNVHKFVEPTALSTDDAGLIGVYSSGRAASIIYWFNSTIPAANDPTSSNVVGQSSASRLPGDGQYRGKAPGGGWAYYIPSQANDPDSAFKYMCWVSSLEVEAGLASGDLAFVRKASYQDPRVAQKYPYAPEELAILDNSYAEPSFEIEQGSQLWQIYLKYFQDTVAGKIKAQDALDKCYTDWDGILKAAGYYS
jgi:ABC-type glycerol-3-phosphate transport system substrate-binding protein